ncbi:hypothetical protein [Streptomyces chartreusis]|uniref:hypothetical protein n=1 Tax=Streptomyces chartreusis TaxID=1969 RepID=UPI00123D8162|nr:hypothetical protein [Streptomyces chartreusis]QEV66235.1 hypothetical protein CP983_05860 [Streptomyces chartreusis]GGW98838.1 hypothetical protein GCM10010321_11600 [Streptomyces chartreusis]
MLRLILWSLLAIFLLVVGAWPAAAAPIGLAVTGAGVIASKIPAIVLLGAAAVAWELRHRTNTTKPATA